MTGRYDAKQICLNGHQITNSYHSEPQERQQRCAKCGEETIFQCPECTKEIRGFFESFEGLSTSCEIAAFCHDCGSPYPWTREQVEGLKMYIDEISELNQGERERLKDVAYHIVVETPRSKAAALRYQNALDKIEQAEKGSREGSASFAQFLFGLATEGVKEVIRTYIPGGL